MLHTDKQTDKQTNKQTNKQINAGKNIYLLAEVNNNNNSNNNSNKSINDINYKHWWKEAKFCITNFMTVALLTIRKFTFFPPLAIKTTGIH